MGRGRKPSPKYEFPAAICRGLSASDVVGLHNAFGKLPCVASLTPEQKEGLLQRLMSHAIDVRLMLQLGTRRRTVKPDGNKARGNRPKVEASFALYLCANSWCQTLGVSTATLLEDHRKIETPAVELARLVLTIASGKPYVASLRQQFNAAKNWGIATTDNNL